jgi:DNA-binding NtrC family response regulator
VRTFATAQEILGNLGQEMPSCLLLDIQLPGLDGFELQDELARKDMQIPIIFLTGHADIPMSVRALKAGAVDFLTKPFNDEHLLEAIRDAIGRHNGNRGRGSAFGEIIGQSGSRGRIISQIELVAPTDATVLILGETGTGKELIAREIHQRSRRSDKPMVRVNCTSIPRELFESEFFGHTKGAFTGAIKDRAGRFEVAAGGTLFLDEVGEIPLELQSKLLRVLQEKSYERVGEDRTRRTDVRIIAATNRDLKKEVSAGRFREDLYYRLNVFPLQVPPLRERKEDIPLLATHVVELLVKELGCAKPRLMRAGIETLQSYEWPGNIRELRNVIERATILARGGPLEFDLLLNGSSSDSDIDNLSMDKSGVIDKPQSITSFAPLDHGAIERERIKAALAQSKGKISGASGAAAKLGMPGTTLESKIRAFKINKYLFKVV